MTLAAIAVNWLDLPLFLMLAAAAVFGGRGGVVARPISWLGVALGIYLGMVLTPDVMRAFPSSSPAARVFVSFLFLSFMAVVGESCGTLVTRWWRARRGTEPDFDPRKAAGDRVAGAIAGVIACGTIVWMLVPAGGAAAGWPARALRGSILVATIDQLYPPQSQRMVEWAGVVADAPFPDAIPPTEEGPPVPDVPAVGLSEEVRTVALTSLVKVTGEACGQVETGSGFVLEPGFVATNAHVVAGQDATSVFTQDDTEFEASVVAFDPRLDVAILAVPDLAAPAMPPGAAQPGTPGAFLGFPGGEGWREAPAALGDEFEAKGTDIFHRSESTRSVIAVGARLEPGYSGAPFVSDEGFVLAMAFAVDPADDDRAYALTTDDIRRVFARKKAKSVSTGACLYD